MYENEVRTEKETYALINKKGNILNRLNILEGMCHLWRKLKGMR